MAASFDPELLHSVARAISDEIRALYNEGRKKQIHGQYFGVFAWSPVVNICRDPRWGRCQETYGEDPFLTSEMAEHFVKGLQEGPDPNYVQVVATCKHFDLHGGPEDKPEDRMQFDAVVHMRDWIETFRPPFQRCVEAGVMSIMCSYNSINGVPSCLNRELLSDLLRSDWKFEGFVVSDCGAIGYAYDRHHHTRTRMQATVQALEAGTDWCCQDERPLAYDMIPSAIEAGLINEATVDVSMRRLLKARFQVGEFDPPGMVTYSSLDLSVLQRPQHKALAKLAALKSIVLLENHELLPLDEKSLKGLAVIGPLSNDPTGLSQLGDYSGHPTEVVNPFQGIQSIFAAATYAAGCLDVHCTSDSNFASAVAVAKEAGLALLVLGITDELESEGTDRDQLELPGLQEALFAALCDAQVPVIVVLNHGGTISSRIIRERAAAVIDLGYGGQYAGAALADVLFGRYNPAGRLPVTVYQSTASLPPIVNYTMQGRSYRFLQEDPLYPFGYGLSYSSFSYSDLRLSQSRLGPCRLLHVTVKLHNTGLRTGEEVVQLYVSDTTASVPVAHRNLVAFRRVDLKAGESRTLEFNVRASQMAVVRDKDWKQVIEPGKFVLSVGGQQPMSDTSKSRRAPSNVLVDVFEVVGPVTPLTECDA
eukprot:GILK01005356.1.p1 GENE.GILK01005356.1~~GILK01005356.1.p1  ORF type:complete len:759 (-),score=104.49 GILK01005356.1:232-2175(-)